MSRRKPTLLPPPGLTLQEAWALPVPAAPPPALVWALADILARLAEEESPPAESGATLSEEPVAVPSS